MSVETGACAAWGKKSTRRRLTSEQDRQAVREAALVTRTAPQPEKRTSPLPARLTFFSPNSKPAFLVELQTAAQYLLLNNELLSIHSMACKVKVNRKFSECKENSDCTKE